MSKSLLPSELLLWKTESDKKKITKVETEKQINNQVEVIGFYFSAHWCPPCRRFTPKLAEFYQKMKKTDKGKSFEIVFVSSDADESGFEKYFREMPWVAIPYSDPQREALGSKWKVNGIPCLILVDLATGTIITKKGVEEVYRDSEGTNFPWTPKSFWQAFEGKLVDKKGNESQMSDLKENNLDVIGLYFSESSLAKQVTPIVESYQKLRKKGAKIEIIFAGVTAGDEDEDESSWKSFLEKMPWKAFGFKDKRSTLAASMFELDRLPTLVLVDGKAGKLISTDGNLLLTEETDDFPWNKNDKSLHAMKASTLDLLNSQPCLLFFPSKGEETKQINILQSVADTFVKKFKTEEKYTKGQENPIAFIYANGHRVDLSVAEFLGISDTRPAVRIINIPEGTKYQFSGTSLTTDTLSTFVTNFFENKLSPLPIRQKERK